MKSASAVWILGLLLWTLGGLAPARAVTCTATAGNITFSGIDILSGAAVNASTTLTINCVTTVLDVTSLGQVAVCPGINAGSGGSTGTVRRMVSGANTLNFGLYSDTARSVSWGTNADTTLGAVPRVDVPVTIPVIGTGGGSASVTVYGQIAGSQTTVPVGSYTSSLTISARYGLLTAPLLGGCSGILGLLPLTATSSFTASAQIDKNCLVTTQNVDFGSQGLLSSNIDASGQVRVTCTSGTSYTVALAVGAYTATTRRMISGAYFVLYGLYQNSGRTIPWGSAGGETVGNTGSGLTQNLTVFGRVPPQTTPPPGTYTDSVAVTVTY
ncbi:spore coat U domain-containing protein [Ancylobacter oerskovii]|uniref:Spore coat protein U domain-containing protein n=1 Tax=Ancylobacter oerskovii TaxID=459519 RepID=A0ABW4Z1U6_9HYPH|nr:spore coat U domain-containing protein [Ancylobacter oerskovii]MBS7544859.1 spore coat U domain-containing protein [Ancylobacter oerskovii]